APPRRGRWVVLRTPFRRSAPNRPALLPQSRSHPVVVSTMREREAPTFLSNDLPPKGSRVGARHRAVRMCVFVKLRQSFRMTAIVFTRSHAAASPLAADRFSY